MFFTTHEFSKGKLLFVKSGKGLVLAHYLRTPGGIEKALKPLHKSGADLEHRDEMFSHEKHLFDRYFDGKREDFDALSLDYYLGTPYQRRVWEAARSIAYGETAAYKDVATKLRSRGYQSVGQALNRNPLIIVVPCHRVISADGSLGGFGAGLELKRFLLELEHIPIPSS
jgi:methylated-DNA-[protein]-cysteine S-methyltransferase